MRLFFRPLMVLTLLVLLGSSGSARGEEEADADLERRKADLLFRLRVNVAIDRGAAWLAAQQHADGSFRLEGEPRTGPFQQSRHRFGESALATLTLAHCGFGPDAPEIQRAVGYLRKHYRSYLKGDHWPQASAYSLSLVVMALHELYAQPGEEDEDEDAGRYGNARRRSENPCGYPSWVRAAMNRILDFFLETRAEEGLFRYPGGLPGGPGPQPGPPGMPARGSAFMGPEDMSNTQYVLLALWIGSRCGYEVPKETLVSIAGRLLAVQEAGGPEVVRTWDPVEPDPGSRYAPTAPPSPTDHARGFGYTPGEAATGSMTAAGLSSLAIVKAMLAEQGMLDGPWAGELDRGMWDAIAWLTRSFTVSGNPPRGPVWHYYYLYGLERACVIAGKRMLGPNDWYRLGGELLVSAQEEDGRWAPGNQLQGFGGPAGPQGPGAEPYRTDHLDTCFALLFLKRAAFPPREPVLPRPVVTPEEPAGNDD